MTATGVPAQRAIGRAGRVAIVSSVHRWNDTRVYVKQARSLAQAGYEVTLVAVAAEHRAFNLNGIRIVPLPRRARSLRWLNWLAILRVVVRLRPWVVHGHDPELFPLLVALRLLGIRAICDVHEDVAEQMLHKEWLPRWMRPLLRGIARRAQTALPSLANAVLLAEDSYVRNFPSRRNVVVVRNFPLLVEDYKHDYHTDVLRLIYVGDVRVVRGIETYVRVVHGLHASGVPAELRVVGSFAAPAEEQRMRELVSELRLADAVIWLGRRRPEDVPGLLTASDIGLSLLHPIGNYRESYPTKMFEYMASGLPVLASNFPLWEAVLVDSDCGRVVEPLDVDAAVRALVDYWRSPDLRARHGRNGRRAIEERYQWHAEARRMLEVYSGLS